jgi:hypothetical protein
MRNAFIDDEAHVGDKEDKEDDDEEEVDDEVDEEEEVDDEVEEDEDEDVQDSFRSGRLGGTHLIR